MSRLFFRWLLWAAVVMPGAVQAVAVEVIKRAWQPPVTLAGQGDPALAVARLREYVGLQRLVMAHTDIHPETQQFIDELWASLESFDLDRFYRLLPERDDDWRTMQVYGQATDDRYRVGPAPLGLQAPVPALGEFEARIRAQEIEQPKTTHYLLNGEVELGLGDLTWPSMLQSTEEALRLMGQCDAVFARDTSADANDFRRHVHAMNPALTTTEVESLAPLWAAFPDIWTLLASVGEVENLLTAPVLDGTYRSIEASFVIDPEKLRHAYPTLASHLDRLDSLLHMQLDLHDRYGRLLALTIDTETLRGQLTMTLHRGQLVPTRGGQPVLDVPPFDPRIAHDLVAHIDTRMDILGIIARVSDMDAEIRYRPTPTGARFEAAVTRIPKVQVGGRALGLVPADFINIFLPRHIDELVVDFLTVACEGNGGRGITASAEVSRPQSGKAAQLSLEGTFEGLDNFLVRIGMGIVNDRVIPDEAVSEELRQLVFDAHEAFSRDLDQFERLTLSAP
ncbi:hypothetical protein [Marinobacter fonticola]|uniref:hypothetical protein n=1 Tax=Marinobacter fonticola TaxID=2603215 RepID=UPI0011E874DB|nr:hypothetical protein [Marinobacter fonticola]